MALDYQSTSDLMKDETFRGRVQVACLKFADYIAAEANTVPAHTTRMRWAQNTFASPMQSATQCMPAVVMDPAVQQDGAAITDAKLQTATENAINKMM